METEHVENDDFNETEEITSEHREGLMKILSKAIGLDVTAITLPVSVNEPASFLMRLYEQIQYSDLLDKANHLEESTERLLYVSVFAASLFSVAERTGKPFNPLLGETFEMRKPEQHDLKFIAEQVSHHPPIGACHAENKNFKFWQAQQLKTRFTGNSLDCHSLGSTNVVLKAWNEHYRWQGLRTAVNNVIVGKVYIDHYGTMEIVNKKNGETAKLEFVKCGWFSKGWHEVTGTVFDSNGTPCWHLFGKWNESIYCKRLIDERNRSSSESSASTCSIEERDSLQETKREKKEKEKRVKEQEKSIRKHVLQSNEAEPIWVHTHKPLPKVPCKYMHDWTSNTLKTVELTSEMEKTLPKTDSRLRADRLALERGDVKAAGAAKHKIEEKQRYEAKQRKTPWVPRYFKQSSEDPNDYIYLENYWSN